MYRLIDTIFFVFILSVVLLWLTLPANAGQYCIPYTQGLEYQQQNGWELLEEVPKVNETIQLWGSTNRSFRYNMTTIFVPYMYDLRTGRHEDMMCQRVNLKWRD